MPFIVRRSSAPNPSAEVTDAAPAARPRSSFRLLDSGVPLLLMLVAAFVMLQYGTSGVLNPDFYLHILNGEWILGHYALPDRDVFSWTAPGVPYVAGQWGSEVLLTVAWLLAGGWGTKTVAALTACGLLFAMHRAANIQFRDVFGSTAATMLLSGGTLLALQARPEIFSYLLFAVVVLVVEHWREHRQGRVLYWLPPIMLLWVNLDGGFAVGMAYLAVSAAGIGTGFVLKEGNRKAFWSIRPFAIAALAAGLCTLANPFGFAAWSGAMGGAANAAAQAAVIPEWAAPTLRDRAGLQLVIVVIMMAAAAGFSRRRLRAEEFCVFSAFLFFGYAAKANVPYFMIAMLPILSRLGSATAAAEWVRPRLEAPASLFSQSLVLAFAVPIFVGSAVGMKAEGERAFRKNFSVAALDFLIGHRMTERVMHGFDDGSYFAYAAGMKVFADRRTEVFGNRFVSGYLDAINGRTGYLDFVAAWNPNAILLPSSAPLKPLLVAAGHYAVVFESGNDTILAKRGAGFDELIERYGRPPVALSLR